MHQRYTAETNSFDVVFLATMLVEIPDRLAPLGKIDRRQEGGASLEIQRPAQGCLGA
jgi:hypothetical protein